MMPNPLPIIQNVHRATGWLPPIYKRDDYDDDAYHAYREEQLMNDHILDYMFNR